MNTPPQTKQCPMCAEEIKADAKKCKHCGELLSGETKPAAPASRMERISGRRMPYWKALPSVIGVGFLEIGGGIALTFTIIGGLVGIPLIVVGIFSIIGSPFLAFTMYEGTCPNCGKALIWPSYKRSVKCRDCKQRFLVER